MRGLSAPPTHPPDLEDATAEEVLRFAVQRWHPRLAVACSFQKEASVIMDLVARIEPEVRFFTLDTGLLFGETHATWEALERRYGIAVRRHTGITLAEQADREGDALWARDPDRCCGLRKVAPLRRALEGADAWVAGVRREQSPARAATPKVDWDARHGLWKVNPLADWTARDVWRHIADRDVPYHPLHDRGYDSIGCMPCTAPAAGREGRWAGSAKLECGLHG